MQWPVIKSAAHKKIVWARLFDLVKNARLATITLPEKPAGLAQWEAGHRSGPPATSGRPPLAVTKSPAPEPPNAAVPIPVIQAAAGSQEAPQQPQPTQVRPSAFAAFGASQLNAA